MQTVVISDVHLWQAVETDGLWMRYRQPDLFPDQELARLFDTLAAHAAPGELEVVFAGDIFDFDVPVIREGKVDPTIIPTDAASAVGVLDLILDEHPVFVEGVAKLLADGHWVTFMSGNHDLQLAFPAVRQALRERVLEAARHVSGPVDLTAMARRLRFRSWFHRTATGVLVEHGSQYDKCCSVLYPMNPVLSREGTLAPTMGSLAMRELVARLGYFNPNVDSSFLLTARGYFQHWLRYYAFREHSLVRTWLVGSIRIALGIVTSLETENERRASHDRELAGAETMTSSRILERHRALFERADLGLTARILGLDGVGIAVGLAIALSITTALKLPWIGLAFALLVVGSAIAFRVRTGDGGLDAGYERIRKAQRKIGELHDARAVVFGHTHVAEGSWDERGVFLGNSGTWSPTFADVACTIALHHGRTFIWLRDAGELQGGLHRFVDGRIEPIVARMSATRTPAAA
jgi:hypothetical protein